MSSNIRQGNAQWAQITRLSEIPVNVRVALFGAGAGGAYLAESIKRKRSDVEIVCFVDSSRTGHLDGIKIVSPDDVLKISAELDAVIIASFYSKEILESLSEKLLIKCVVAGRDLLVRDTFKDILYRALSKLNRLLRKSAKRVGNFYETTIATFLASRAGWLLWPVFKALDMAGVRFVVNISDGIGHIMEELHYFFKMVRAGKNDGTKLYVWIRKSTTFSKTCVRFYGKGFSWAVANNLLYYLSLPLIYRYRSIGLDSGWARTKRRLTADNKYYKPAQGKNYLYQISRKEGRRRWHDFILINSQQPDYFPLREMLPPDQNNPLMTFLGDKTEKLALIHVKTLVGNATAKLTDAGTYIDALSYLSDSGYRLVLVGREQMPTQFLRFNMLNYSESEFATFENDIRIFSIAKIAVVAGSGIALLPSCLNVPYVYMNSWHLTMPSSHKMCVVAPTLVKNIDGKLLKFVDQIKLHESLPDFGPENFPSWLYEARDITSNEMLEAVIELDDLTREYKKRSDLQEKYCTTKSEYSVMELSMARASQKFLEKHEALL